MKLKPWLSIFLICVWLLSPLKPFLASPKVSLSYLAPITEEAFFYLSPKQVETAKALLQTLEKVFAFLEAEEPNLTAFGWIHEDGFFHFREYLDKEDLRAQLIPHLRFYQFLGEENLQQLKQLLSEAIEKKGALQKKLPLRLETPVGLYRFLLVTQSLEANIDRIVPSIQLSSFYQDRPEKSKPLTTLTGKQLLQRIYGFHLLNKQAADVASKLFSEDKRFKTGLSKQTEAAIRLTKALHLFAQSITTSNIDGEDKHKREIILSAEKLESLLTTFHFSRQDLIKALNKQYGAELKQTILFHKQEIEEHFIALSLKEEEVSFLNLLALISQETSVPYRVIAGVTDIELQLDQLLALSPRSEQAIVSEVIYRLTEQEKFYVGSYEADLSRTFLSFKKEAFQNRGLFFNLLKILTLTSKFAPLLEGHLDEKAYNRIIQQNILTALKKFKPNWFLEAISFLNEEETFDDAVLFLSATGWIDSAIQLELQQKKQHSPHIHKIKKLLKEGVIVTAQTVQADESLIEDLKSFRSIQYWPEIQRIDFEFDKLQVFNFIKYKLFFSKEPLNQTSVALAFISPETFLEVAEEATTLQALKPLLAERLGIEKAKLQMRGFYHYAQQIYNTPYRASILFLDSLTKSLFKVAAFSDSDLDIAPLQSILFQMKSFLSLKSIRSFLRELFYHYLVEEVRAELRTLFMDKSIISKIRKELAQPNTTFPKLEADLLTVFSTYATAEAALKAVEDQEPEAILIKYLKHPAAFVRENSDHFGKDKTTLKSLIPQVAQKTVESRIFSAYNNILKGLLENLKQGYDEGESVFSLWNELAVLQIKTAPNQYLNLFAGQEHLTEIRTILKLDSIISEFKKRPINEIDVHHRAIKRMLQLFSTLQNKRIFDDAKALEQFIQNPIPPRDFLFPPLITIHHDNLNQLLLSQWNPDMNENL